MASKKTKQKKTKEKRVLMGESVGLLSKMTIKFFQIKQNCAMKLFIYLLIYLSQKKREFNFKRFKSRSDQGKFILGIKNQLSPNFY